MDAAGQRCSSRTVGRQHRIEDYLSPRQIEVARLIAEGLDNCAIAERLSVSRRTVRNHLTLVFRRLGVQTRLELVILLIKRRWVAIDELAPGLDDQAEARRLQDRELGYWGRELTECGSPETPRSPLPTRTASPGKGKRAAIAFSKKGP